MDEINFNNILYLNQYTPNIIISAFINIFIMRYFTLFSYQFGMHFILRTHLSSDQLHFKCSVSCLKPVATISHNVSWILYF